MLAQIITDNVGEMNKALAKTDAGKQKQLANEMGALKAKIGSLVSSVAPYLNVGASIANMAMGFMSLRNVVVAFSSKIGSAYMAFDGLLLKTMPFTARMKWVGAALRMCGLSALKKRACAISRTGALCIPCRRGMSTAARGCGRAISSYVLCKRHNRSADGNG